ncbi:hypothetical protein FRC03_003071 [Tulasnella sp. 419]|nr:hypothetical protein FRC03_003071 [Tulasnella sp. 419]
MSSPTQEVNPSSLPPRIWDPPLDPQDRKSPRPQTPPPPSNRPPQEPPAAPEFVPGSPTPSYIAEVLLPPAITPKIEVKLLILDLNGTLGYRKRSNQTMNPRPYLGSFADYVTHWKSGLETMVWSSAKPHNVDKMVKRCFGRRKLRAVWARDTLGLNTDDYNRKVQTVKDLKIVWKGLENHNFSASNTILLDDSSIKAHMQPYNHVVLKEYDEVLCAQDQCARSTESVDNDSLDQTLLAVIGILHEAVRYDNVGSWIRSGGLWAGLRDISALPPGTASAGNGERAPAFAQQDVKVDNMIAESVEHSAESTLGNNIWYQDPDVLQTWITRGIAALKEFKIPIRP